MEPTPWYKNWKVIAAAVVVLLLLSALGYMGNKVKTLEVNTTSLVQERDQLLQVSRTAETRILTAEQRARTAESRFKNLRAAKNPITGEALFDQAGQVIMETEEGSSTETESLRRDLDEIRTEKEQLVDQVSMVKREFAEYRKETERPAQSPWDFGLGYSAPVATWLNYLGATYWGGAGYHLKLLTLDVGVNAHLGWQPAAVVTGESIQGKLFINFRP